MRAMARRLQHVPLIAAIIGAITLAVHAQPRSADEERPVRLRAATFTPARGESPAIRASMMRGEEREGVDEYIVQFEGPVLEAWKAGLATAGAEIHEYVPEFAFKVRMNRAAAARVRRLPFVAWVGAYHPAYKLGPELARDRRRAFVVRLSRGANRADTEAALAAAGIQTLQSDGSVLLLSADASDLDAIARIQDVESVENFVLRRKHGDFAGVIVGGGVVNANGFDGSTQTIAVADTGLGDGAAAGASCRPARSRVSAIVNWPGAPDFCFDTIYNDGAADVDSGHGTHVRPSPSSGNGDGVAPGRRQLLDLAVPVARELRRAVDHLQLFYGIPDGYYLVGIPGGPRPALSTGIRRTARASIPIRGAVMWPAPTR